MSRVLDALLHWDEMTPEQQAERRQAETAKKDRATMLAAMKTELAGVETNLSHRREALAEAEAVDASKMAPADLYAYQCDLSSKRLAVESTVGRIEHITEQIKKAS